MSFSRYPSGLAASLEVDATVDAVLLVGRARGEEERIGRLGVDAVAEGDPPQAVDRDRAAGRRRSACREIAPVAGSKALILPSPKLPTSSALLKVPKLAGAIVMPQGALSLPPGGDQSLDQIARGVEDIDRADARRRRPRRARCASCIAKADEDLVADRLDAERRVAGRQCRSVNAPGADDRREVRVEDVDDAVVEVGRVEQRRAGLGGDRQALVDLRFGRAVDDLDGIGQC